MADSPKDPVFDLLRATYKQNPNVFSLEDVDFLKDRAKSLGVDFSPQPTDFNLARTAQQALYGFINGFSTLSVGEQPRNDVEAIFHNIGHLAGFMGYVPGAGTLAKLSATGFAKGAAFLLSEEIAAKGSAAILKRGISGLSIPMVGAEWLTKGASSFISKNAALESVKFLQNGVFKDIVGGAFHLGVASSISAAPFYHLELDKRLDGFLSGLEAGVVFKAIGNGITLNVLKKSGAKLGLTTDLLNDPDTMKSALYMQQVGRILAASMYMGLPSTMRDEPGLIQAMQYITGAAFGYKERSVHETDAQRFLATYRRKEQDFSLWNVMAEKPTIKGWEDLSEASKDLVRADVSFSHGRLFSRDEVKRIVEDPSIEMDLSEGGVIAIKGYVNALELLKKEVKEGKTTDPKRIRDTAAALEFGKRMQELKNEGLSEDKAYSKAMEEAGNADSTINTIAEQYADIVKKVKQESDASSVADVFLSDDKRFEIRDAIMESGADARFTNVFYDAARSIQQKENLQSEGLFRMGVLKDMFKKSAEVSLAKGTAEDFITSIEKTYGAIGEEEKGRLKQVWLNINDAQVQPQITPNTDGELRQTNEFNAVGERNTQLRPFSFGEDIIRGLTGEQSRVEFMNEAYETTRGRNGSQVNTLKKLYEIIDIDKKDESALPGIMINALKEGKTIFTGMKAEDRLVLIKDLVKNEGIDPQTQMTTFRVLDGHTFDVESKLSAADQIIEVRNAEIAKENEVRRAQGLPDKKLMMSASDAFSENLFEFGKIFKESKNPEWNKLSDEEIFRLFEKNFANNIAFLEQLNGDGKNTSNFMPWENIIAFPDKFITRSDQLNKRAQVLFAGEHRFQDTYIDGLPGVVKNEATGEQQLRYLITKTSDMLNEKSGKIFTYEMRGDKIERIEKDTEDGAIYPRSDIFDKLLEWSGLDKNTGHQKGVIVYTEAGLGGLIVKHAYHRPSEALDKFMFDNDLHITMPDSSVKQTGLRETHGMRYNDRDGYRVVGRTNPDIIPILTREGLSEQQAIDFIAGKKSANEIVEELIGFRRIPGMGRVANNITISEREDGSRVFTPESDIAHLIPTVTDTQSLSHSEAYSIAIEEGISRLERIKSSNANIVSVYNLPANRLTINFSAGERPSNIENVRAVVQLYSNLNKQQVSQDVIDEAYRFIKQHGFDGDPEHNAFAKTYNEVYNSFSKGMFDKSLKDVDIPAITKQLDTLADQIDVRKLGFNELIQILKPEVRIETKLYDKVMRYILHLDKMGELKGDDEGIIDADSRAIEQAMDSQRVGAMRIFDSATRITPALVDLYPGTKKYANAVITSYLMRQLKRPEIPYSMKMVMTPMSLDEISKFNLKPGEYMVDEGAKNKIIEFHTEPGIVKEMTLGEAWDIYQGKGFGPEDFKKEASALGGIVFDGFQDMTGKQVPQFTMIENGKRGTTFYKNDNESLFEAWQRKREQFGQSTASNSLRAIQQKDLTHAIVRVPADSMSGVRMLKFRGFTGKQGFGITLHPEDMMNLGGADYDIDSAFVYTKLPEAMKSAFSKTMDEWYKYYKFDKLTNTFLADLNGNPIETTKDDPIAQRVFAPAKSQNLFGASEDPALLDLKKHPVSIANPVNAIDANRNAWDANSQLGPGINHTRRLRTVFDMFGPNSSIPLNITPKFNGELYAKLQDIVKKSIPDASIQKLTFRIQTPEDNSAIRNATREIVNTAADAEHKLKPRLEIANIISNAITRDGNLYADVQYEINGRKASSSIPIPLKELGNEKNWAYNILPYSALGKLDMLMKGYDFYNQKKFNIEELLTELKSNAWKMQGRGEENVYYHLAKDLTELPYTISDNPKIFGASWTGLMTKKGGFVPGAKAEFDKWINSKDPLAQTYRDFSFRKYIHIASNIPRGTNRMELEAQDAADVVSALSMKDYGEAALKAGHKMETLTGIVKKIDDYRRDWSILRKNDATAEMLDKYSSKALNQSDLYREMSGYFKGLYSKSKELGDFASAWYTGSLYSQSGTWREVVGPYDKTVQDLKNKLNDVLQEPNPEVKSKLQSELGFAEEALKQKQSEFYQTNSGMIGANSPFIPDYIIRDFYDRFSNLVGATFKSDFGVDDVKDIAMRSAKGPSAQMQELQPESVAFNQTSRIPDLVDIGEVKRFQQSFYKSIPKVAKIELDARHQKLTDDLTDFLYKHPQFIPHYHEKLFGQFSADMGGFGTTPNIIRLEQIRNVLDYYNKLFNQKGGKGYPLKPYHYAWAPEMFNKHLLPYDAIEFVRKDWIVATGIDEKGAVLRDMPIRTFMSTFEAIRQTSNATSNAVSSESAIIDRDFKQTFKLYYDLGNDAATIANYVTALRESTRGRSSAEETAYYGDQLIIAEKAVAPLKNKKWLIPLPEGNGTREMNFAQVVEEMRNIGTSKAKANWERWIYNERFDSYLTKSFANSKDFTPEEMELKNWIYTDKNGFIHEEKTAMAFLRAAVGYERPPVLSQEFLNRLRWQEMLSKRQVDDGTGKMIRIRDLAKSYEERYAIMRNFLNSDQNKDRRWDYKSLKDNSKIFFDEYHPHVNHTSGEIKKAKERKLAELRASGLGEIELQKAEMEIKNEIEMLTAPDKKMHEESEDLLEKDVVTDEMITQGGLSYIPSNLQHRARSGGPIGGYDRTPFAWLKYDRDMAKAYHQGIEAFVTHHLIEKFERSNNFGTDTPAWTQFMKQYRRDNLGLPSLFPKSWLENKSFYIKNNAYYYFTDQAMFDFLKKFEKKLGAKYSSDSELTWENYRRIIHENGGMAKISAGTAIIENSLYKTRILSNIGNRIEIRGSELPEAILVDYGASRSHLKQAYTFAEQNKIPVLFRNNFDANLKPKRLAGPSDINLDRLAEARKISTFLSKMSNLEGKYQLISLLSHTKTMLGNVTTGYINTAIQTGFAPLRNARDLNYIRSLMPEIKSKDDLNKFRETSGALEAFIREEIGENISKTESFKRFFDEAAKTLKKDPSLPDQSIVDIAKKYRLSEAVVEKAAWFMRASEVIIRGDAWMAHYLKAREVLEANNYVFKTNNHPWLIQMANRGVAASQFLYNNANKPAFARTNLGKVYFRFQQWAWQSFLMRKDIFEKAGAVNLREGAPETERLKRLLTADLFVFGLASLFPATVFNSMMAPPMNTMVNISDWFFGDKKEKDQAFYGAIPYPMNILNPIIPPVGRIPTSVFSSMVSGDWEKFAQYNIWTWFPFGRIGRDINKTLESPTMVIENFTNIPIHQFERTRRREAQLIESSRPKQMFHSFLRDALSN